MKAAGATYNDPQAYSHKPDQLFRHLFDLLPVAVYTCDKNGYITFFNKAAASLWGQEPRIGEDTWCGSWRIYTSEGEPVPLDTCPMASVLKLGREIEACEIVIERPDGSRRIVVPHPKLLFDENGELDGAMNMLEDITDTKEDSRKAAILAAIVKYSNAAIISKTLSGIVTSWNPAAQHIFGYAPAEIIGQPIVKLIPHDLFHEEEMILAKLNRGEMIEHMETKRLTKSGNLIDVSLTVSPVKDERGKIIGVSKIARDITSIKRNERTIRESEEKFRMAVEATKLGTWEYNMVDQELTWSGETRRIYGLSDTDKVDYSVFLRHIHPDDYESVTREVEKALDPTGTGSYDVTFRIRRKNGNVRWVRAQGKSYFNENKISERFIGTILDVTDEKNKSEGLEQQVSERTRELKMMNKQLQRSNSDLAQFASVASHDLQEPLRKVQMYCDRILDLPDDKAVYEKFLPRIISAASRMSQLIKDVLHYAQIPDGTERMEDVDLNAVFENVVSDLEVIIREKNAKVTSDFLPSIKGNETQLRQLFSNLVNNAVKFSAAAPEIRITSVIRRKSEVLGKNKNIIEAPSYVELKFRDNGIGFEQKYAGQIFDIFQRLQDRTVYSGTGIGLAVCKKIVENHHGVISVVSEPGAGTTFTILLPTG
ncbi:MAG: PAS domain S-box protein [Chitinophagaceae bacterium]|nr:PAS domain S-box protein [Chitinophagaceae bacterium]